MREKVESVSRRTEQTMQRVGEERIRAKHAQHVIFIMSCFDPPMIVSYYAAAVKSCFILGLVGRLR